MGFRCLSGRQPKASKQNRKSAGEPLAGTFGIARSLAAYDETLIGPSSSSGSPIAGVSPSGRTSPPEAVESAQCPLGGPFGPSLLFASQIERSAFTAHAKRSAGRLGAFPWGVPSFSHAMGYSDWHGLGRHRAFTRRRTWLPGFSARRIFPEPKMLPYP